MNTQKTLIVKLWVSLKFFMQLWYPLSKTLAEKAAWEFAEKNGLDIVVVNPGTVMGPVIPPSINASMGMLLRLLEGTQLICFILMNKCLMYKLFALYAVMNIIIYTRYLLGLGLVTSP